MVILCLIIMTADLFEKYDVPAPRYTSYPTVPYWNNIGVTEQKWKSLVATKFDETNATHGISIYIHLPYCESLCTYCGCNMRITKNHLVEEPYIDTVIKEWNLYLQLFKDKPIIKEIHLGGGTPTFFSAENLERLIKEILFKSKVATDFEFSIEAHPNYTKKEQLKVLHDLGFKRISFGIQDFDLKVQKTINRIQSFETVAKITEAAREIGFNSINYDLIYGLPYQTLNSIEDTISKVNILKPDRIAFYSYAHVPWIKPGQRSYTDADLPSGAEKRKLYELGRNLLEANNYKEIGMDHFALDNDPLSIAANRGTLHRNFMGYTTNSTRLLVGLGASSISDCWNGFVQNEKKVEDYQQQINEGKMAITKGHFHTAEDSNVRKHITNLMCNYYIEWNADEKPLANANHLLEPLAEDGLIYLFPGKLIVTQKGKPFLRNICMALDKRLLEKQAEKQLFSSAV